MEIKDIKFLKFCTKPWLMANTNLNHRLNMWVQGYLLAKYCIFIVFLFISFYPSTTPTDICTVCCLLAMCFYVNETSAFAACNRCQKREN